jgi:hypothetical protein
MGLTNEMDSIDEFLGPDALKQLHDSIPEYKPKLTTFYYPETPEATRAAGLSPAMEGGTQGGGKFSDVDLRNHTLEKFQSGDSPFVAVAMKGAPSGGLFRMMVGGHPIVAKNIDTGGGLRPDQVDVATSDPELARRGVIREAIAQAPQSAMVAGTTTQAAVQAGGQDPIDAFLAGDKIQQAQAQTVTAPKDAIDAFLAGTPTATPKPSPSPTPASTPDADINSFIGAQPATAQAGEIPLPQIQPTEQELSTLAAPEGSPQYQDALAAKVQPLNQVPGAFAEPPTLEDAVDMSIPRVNEEGVDVPRLPQAIGEQSVQQAFQSGGLIGAGAYLGQMSELPYARSSAQLAMKIMAPQLMSIADTYPNTPTGQIVKGLSESVADNVSQLAAPSNLALIASGQALPGIAGKLVTGWFLGQMARQLPDQWQAYRNAPTLAEKTRLLGNMATAAGIIAIGGKELAGKGEFQMAREARAKSEILKDALRSNIKPSAPPVQPQPAQDVLNEIATTPGKITPEQKAKIDATVKSETAKAPSPDTALMPPHTGGLGDIGAQAEANLRLQGEAPALEVSKEGAARAKADAAAKAKREQQTLPLMPAEERPTIGGKRRESAAEAAMRKEYEAQTLADFEEHMAQGGDELLDVLLAHGLPVVGATKTYKGELNQVREMFRSKRGFARLVSGEPLKYSQVFRKGAGSLDSLTSLLQRKGFNVDNVSDTLALIHDRLVNGKKSFGMEARADAGAITGLPGMGAAGATEVLRPDQPTARQLNDMVSQIQTGDPLTFSERLAEWRKRQGQAVKNAAATTADVVKSLAVGFKRTAWDPPTRYLFDQWKGRWDQTMQYNDFYIKELGKNLERAIPNRSRQEAIFNWVAADGDKTVLQDWINRAPLEVRKGYEDALHLSTDEETVGNQIRSAYDEWFDRAIENGMLEAGVENYAKRVIKNKDIQSNVMARIASGRFSTNFAEAKHRFWDEMVDAEREGVRYDKRLRTTSLYAQSFEHAAINRIAKKQLFNMELENGRPAMIVEGKGIPVDQGGIKPSLMVTPYGMRNIKAVKDMAVDLKRANPKWSDERAIAEARERILSEYTSFDNPAFKNWQWVYKDPVTGADTFVHGNALVHNSIAGQLHNAFVQERLQWMDPILKAQGFYKGSKLSLSAFHQVHEMINAFGHLTKVANLKSLGDYLEDPQIQRLQQAGLQLVGGANEKAQFAEGIGSHGWPDLVPGLGKYVRMYKDFLFEDYIPRLKAEAALNVLDRNVKGGLTGLRPTKRLTKEQNEIITARQVNASFGEQNYRQMMRDPRLQQMLRAMFLAPDFGEAKLRNVGQVFTKYGGEQRMALGMVAGTLYMGARLLNQAISGNPQWDKPFTVIIGDRQYTLRSLPGDMAHMISQPMQYVRWRLSPGMNAGIEMLFKRDTQGNVVNWSEAVTDSFVRGLLPLPLSGRKGQSFAMKDALASAAGVTPLPYRYETEVRKLIGDFRKHSNDPKLMREQERYEKEGFLPSEYAPMRDALRNGNLPGAGAEYQKLVAGGKDPSQVAHVMGTWVSRPLTGSRTYEDRFVRSLSATDLKLYKNAVKEREFIYGQFQALLRGENHYFYPSHLEQK